MSDKYGVYLARFKIAEVCEEIKSNRGTSQMAEIVTFLENKRKEVRVGFVLHCHLCRCRRGRASHLPHMRTGESIGENV